MTHDRTKPPSDELMGRVMRDQYGIDIPVMLTRSTEEPHPIIMLTAVDGSAIDVKDARYDTNAALELLGWVRTGYALRTHLAEDGRNWLVYTAKGTVAIPISGQPFRTAVCWLAVDVLLGGD